MNIKKEILEFDAIVIGFDNLLAEHKLKKIALLLDYIEHKEANEENFISKEDVISVL